MATRKEIAKAKTRTELEALALKYGYSFGWVNQVLRARQARAAGNN